MGILLDALKMLIMNKLCVFTARGFLKPENGEGRFPFGKRPSWVQEADLNRRPSGYEPDELPDCSILQQRKPWKVEILSDESSGIFNNFDSATHVGALRLHQERLRSLFSFGAMTARQ
jgi:hypothetical protein